MLILSAAPSYLISRRDGLTPPVLWTPSVNSYSAVGRSGEVAQLERGGGFGLNLEASMGMMVGFGDRRGFLLRR